MPRSSVAGLLAALRGAPPTERAARLVSLDRALTGELPHELKRLAAGLDARPFGVSALPAALAERWIAADGRELVEITPRENINDNAAAKRFVSSVRAVVPSATGLPVVNQEASRTVVLSFQLALLYAFVMVALLLWIFLRRLRDVLYVIVPIVLAAGVTAGAMVLLGIPLNFANIIALPLLAGVGVDNGIHIVHRMRTEPAEDRRPFGTSTSLAVLASGLTTVASFGNLAFASHVGHCEHGPAAHARHARDVGRDARAAARAASTAGAGMTALVTGANGFVGAAVVRALLAEGESVRAFVRAGADRRNLEGLDVECREGDITVPETLRAAAPGCRYVLHVAADYRLWAPDAERMLATNVQGSLNVLEAAAAAGAERLVYTSSVATLGLRADRRPADEETPVALADMIGPYKRSKFLAEQAVRGRAAEIGFPVVTVNPSTPIGPGDVKPTPTGRVILDAAAGRMPAFVDTGLNLVHVDDVAAGHVAALRRGRPGERYILGGEDMSLERILELVALCTGRRAPRLRLPRRPLYPVAWIAERVATVTGTEPRVTLDGLRMAAKHMYFSSAKAERELGFRWRDPAEAVRDAVGWFRRNGYL